jgi:hypothetical protein
MQAQHQSSSDEKATTPARHLVTTAIIGAAMIGYLVHKTPDDRLRLESLATRAQNLGELSATDLALVTRLLETHPAKRPNFAQS